MRHSDFDKKVSQFDKEFTRMARRGKLFAIVMLPLYVIGVLLVLGLLAVALYGLAHAVGLL